MNRPIVVTILSIGILCGMAPSRACGPFLNEAILDLGFAILRAPETSFELEVGKIDLDKPLPGGLVMPDKIKVFDANYLLTKGWAELLFESKGDDLLTSRDGCRTALLVTNVDLARDVAEVAAFLKTARKWRNTGHCAW
jgi:hypothetical protein